VFRDNSAWSHLFTRLPVSGDGQYVYDPIYRLIQATGREHPGQQPTNADPVRGNVPHQNDIQALLRYTEQYEYDESGNITTVNHTATGNNWNREYQYSSTGNILLGTSAPADQPGTYSNTYTYNAHGSMVSMSHITQLSWSYVEQLQSTDLGGGGIVYYCYDSSGNRSRKVYEHSGITEDRIFIAACARRQLNTRTCSVPGLTIPFSNIFRRDSTGSFKITAGKKITCTIECKRFDMI
jgi:hypothetical protein